jgi:hypothetical protein
MSLLHRQLTEQASARLYRTDHYENAGRMLGETGLTLFCPPSNSATRPASQSIQKALAQVMQRLVDRQIDHQRAGQPRYKLQMASLDLAERRM